MAKRKTISIEALKAEANKIFRDSVDDYSGQRQAIQSFVGPLLMKADQYKGFGYLTSDQMEAGKTPGMMKLEHGRDPVFLDQTRIRFY